MNSSRGFWLLVIAAMIAACGTPMRTDGGDVTTDTIGADQSDTRPLDDGVDVTEAGLDVLPPDGVGPDGPDPDAPPPDGPDPDAIGPDAPDPDAIGPDAPPPDGPDPDAATDAPADSGCPAGQVACGSPAMCVDTASSNAHCGGCDRPCMSGESCMAGVCVAPCAMGETRCGTACVNTQSDPANCGACARACASGEICTAGVCVAPCPMGETRCGGTCVNTATNSSHCGACGMACPMGQLCSSSTCRITCAAPNTVCGSGSAMVCADLQTDRTNCGMCGRTCAASEICRTGGCVPAPPANDTRASATVINMMAASQVLMATTVGAGNETTSSCGTACGAAAMQPDVFYRFTLARREVVYADTFGATWDTQLFLQTTTGMNLTPVAGTGGVTCSDDACSALQSQISAVLPAGTYNLVLAGCRGMTGTASVRFQHLPVGATAVSRIAPTGMQTLMGTTAGANGFNSGCGGSGPELSYYWTTCPSAAATSFHAFTCGLTGVDTVLSQFSASRAPIEVCNNDACGPQSNVMSTLPAGAGLHTFHIDGFFMSAGAVRANVSFGGCATGWASCGGVCRNLQGDAANCGACGRACAAGSTCAMGVCSPPANDSCMNSVPLTLGAAGTTTTVTGTTIGALNSANTCTMGGDVFYRFQLLQRELVYIDTFGSTVDTTVGVSPGFFCGGAAIGCNDNAPCPAPNNATSQTFVVLDPGYYNIHVETPAAMPGGTFTLRVQHFSAPPGAPTGALAAGAINLMGDTRGAANFATTCGGTASPTRWYVWTTCPGGGGGTFTANTCMGTAIDSVLDLRHSNTTTATLCVDDTAACGTGRQSSLGAVIPAGAGAHALMIRNVPPPPALPDRTPGLFLIRGTRP